MFFKAKSSVCSQTSSYGCECPKEGKVEESEEKERVIEKNKNQEGGKWAQGRKEITMEQQKKS